MNLTAKIALSAVVLGAAGALLYFIRSGMRKVSKKGIELIKEFEGCRLEAYKCPAGVWTIGYGHTAGVKQGDKISREQAEAYLKQDLSSFEFGVNSALLGTEVNQNQFDALVSFAFNLGTNALRKSTLLKLVKNNPNDPNIENEFKKWVYADGVVVKGLQNRRQKEADLYFSRI